MSKQFRRLRAALFRIMEKHVVKSVDTITGADGLPTEIVLPDTIIRANVQNADVDEMVQLGIEQSLVHQWILILSLDRIETGDPAYGESAIVSRIEYDQKWYRVKRFAGIQDSYFRYHATIDRKNTT